MEAKKLIELGLKPWTLANPQRYTYYWFEKLDGNKLRYLARQQLPLCAIICVIYVIFVHLGPLWMKHRKPFKLQGPLFMWNFLLAAFSITGTIRIMPEVVEIFGKPDGFYQSGCIFHDINYRQLFWGYAFVLSKIFELGDTVFLVLRKKPVTLLHWLHHMTMVFASFYAFSEGEPFGRYIVAINYFIHSIMYTYFTVKALGIHVPKKLSMGITIAQILQFIIVLSANLLTYIRNATVGDCFRTSNSVMLSFVCGGIYLYLFSKFFYDAYIAKPKSKSE